MAPSGPHSMSDDKPTTQDIVDRYLPEPYAEPAKVFSLRGNPLPVPGTADPQIVEYLTDLLERAKAGEIVGFGAAHLNADRSSGLTTAGMVDEKLIGEAYMLLRHLGDSRARALAG